MPGRYGQQDIFSTPVPTQPQPGDWTGTAQQWASLDGQRQADWIGSDKIQQARASATRASLQDQADLSLVDARTVNDPVALIKALQEQESLSATSASILRQQALIRALM